MTLSPCELDAMAQAVADTLFTQECEVVGRGDQRLETRFGYERIEARRTYACAVVSLAGDRRAVTGDQLARRADVEVLLPRDAVTAAGDRILVGDACLEVVATSHDLALQPCLRSWCVQV